MFRGREVGLFAWGGTAVEIERMVWAFDPWPGTMGVSGGKRLKIFPPVRVEENKGGGRIGEVLVGEDGEVRVVCGVGVLVLSEVQLDGGRRMTAVELMRGRGIEF